MMTAFKLMTEVLNERARQDKLWGVQNHDPARWLSILMEEVGEVAKALNDINEQPGNTRQEQWGQWQQYRDEMVQSVAVLIAMIECFDRKRAKHPSKQTEEN